jgi:hypothetical protein
MLHGDYIAFLCFVWLSEETLTCALYIINRLGFITGAKSVYCAVRAESLYKQIRLVLKGLNSADIHPNTFFV